jgi:hypothetical protein
VIKKSLLPAELIDRWPEVLNDVEIKAVPIEYVNVLRITFTDGKVWEITVDHTKEVSRLEEHIAELVLTYEDMIDTIDFQIDVDRVKRDIIKKTKKFLTTKK